MGLDAMLWDVGGVLVHFAEAADGRMRWQRRLELDDGQLESRLWDAIGSSGVAETAQIIERLARSCGLDFSDAEHLLFDAHDHWLPNTELLDYARSLRRGTRVAVVANAGPAARWAFEAVVGVRDIADVIVVSEEVGLEKPDPAIYRLAADRLGVSPSACAFVDDLQENVDGARRLGIAAFLYENNASTIGAITSVLS